MRHRSKVSIGAVAWLSVALCAVACSAGTEGELSLAIPEGGANSLTTGTPVVGSSPGETPGEDTPGEAKEDAPSVSAEPAPRDRSPTCTTDSECQGVFEASPCEEPVCETLSGKCVLSTLADGTACDAGNPCLLSAVCAAGVCAGQAMSCDDGDPCTDDSCDPGSGCVAVYNTAPCDDGNICTTGEQCSAGFCSGGESLSCDDQNPCTNDACDATQGCVYEPNTALCDDGDPCTMDICQGGACVGTPDPNAQGCEEPGVCAAGEIGDCLGGCAPSGLYGDGVCHANLNCPEVQFDGGDCSDAPDPGCAANELTGCQGGCVPQSLLGNGACDPALDCAAYAFDGGDCTSSQDCGPGQVVACDGSCAAQWQLGNGVCDQAFNCVQFNQDGGDCAPLTGVCPEGELDDCIGGCLSPLDLGKIANGVCDPELNCFLYMSDGGDCEGGAGCTAMEFTCGDGACIPSNKVCDGVMDCLMGDDEAECAPDVVCAGWELANCAGGCTQASWYGDGQCDSDFYCAEADWDGGDCLGVCPYDQYEDCLGGCHEDGSALGDGTCDDEWNCEEMGYDGGDCAPSACANNQFTCLSDGACIPDDWQCDGVDDCDDGSDELECAPDDGCASYQTKNCEGGCTQASWLGDNDCDSALNCAETDWDAGDCPPDGSGCNPDEVPCASLLSCIPESYLCDGYMDCMDGSDEVGCGDGQCASDEFTCVSDGTCISGSWECDGWTDCADGSDELSCGADNGCASYQVPNCEGGCTQASWLGDNDCDSALNCAETGWDDGDCPPDGSGCDLDEFSCGPGSTCVPQSYVCDGYPDCLSGADEEGCPVPICDPWQFTCLSDGACIADYWQCDGWDDCADGSDEIGCSAGEVCASYEVENCEGGCTLAVWLGDNECDMVLNCMATNWDAGDCPVQ